MEITKEQLRERARGKMKSLQFAAKQTAFADARAELEEELELARIALASLEAEPVCVIDQSNLDYLKSGSDADVWPASRTEMGDVLLYRAAPPAPVSVKIPPEKPHTDGPLADGWNACRAAMLQGAENAESRCSNSPVIPDGLCPCCGRKPLKNKTCSVAGCDDKHVARGLCAKHYAIERKKDPSLRESIRAADKRYRARKAAAPQQEVK